MLDITYIRENTGKVKKACEAKQVKCDVDRILELDKQIKILLPQKEGWRAEQKKLGGKDIKKASQLKKEIKDAENFLRDTRNELMILLHQLPNISLEGVPAGGEKNNQVLRQVGKVPSFDFEAKDHLALGEDLDVIDVKRAAKISGARFAYLKGDAALLEFALVQLAIEEARKEGFTPIVPPVLVRGGNLEELGYDMGNYYLVSDERCPKCNHAISWRGKVLCEECGTNQETEVVVSEGAERLKCHYCKELTRLTYFYLVGTAEHAIAPMHSKEIFEERDLPKRYVGFSSAFRRESGTYGKDTRGILRVHQFDKVELISFTKPEDSQKEHELLLNIEERLWKKLEIPYQVVQLASGDSSLPSASTIDIEAWLPGQGKYREVSSASNTTAFQARRLNIRYRGEKGTEFVHILNATGFAIGRTLIAIVENYQEKDGSIAIPKVLQQYVGKKKIEKK